MSLPIKFALRFIFISIFLISMLSVSGGFFLKLLVPLYRWEINHIDSGYRILSFNMDNAHADAVYLLRVNLSQAMFVGGRFIFPNPQGMAEASSIVYHVWQIVVPFLATVLAWKVSSPYAITMRFLIGLPVLTGILMLDIPFALLASIKELIIQQLALETFSMLIFWNNFLEGGGRIALALSAGVMVIRIANFMLHKKIVAIPIKTYPH